MTFSRLVLVVTGTVFIAYGIAFLAVPVLMAAGAGIALPVPTAVTDVRAVYGGLQLGLGCLLICWSRRPSLTTAGLYAIVATLGGITLGRTLGIVVNRSAETANVIVLAFEATGPICAFVALAWERITAHQYDAAYTREVKHDRT